MGHTRHLGAALVTALATASCAIIANLGDRTLGTPDDGGSGSDATNDGNVNGQDGDVPTDGGLPGDGATAADVVTPPFDAPPGCVIDNFPASLVPAQLYLAVDVSASMTQALPAGPTRFATEAAAVNAFVADPRSASLFAAMDTHPWTGAADAGCEPTPYESPPVPLGQLGTGTAAAITAYLAPLAPVGSSPWTAMLAGALQFTKTAAIASPARSSALVFIADSTPTACGTTAADLVAIVQPYAQGTPAVRTFFLGITQVATDVTTYMDPVAAAGGTTKAYALVPPTQVSMQAALAAVRDEMACVAKLPAVGGKPVDVAKGLFFLQTGATQVTTSQVTGAAACATQDAWYPGTSPDRIHLCPTTCNRLLGDATAKAFVAACR